MDTAVKERLIGAAVLVVIVVLVVPALLSGPPPPAEPLAPAAQDTRVVEIDLTGKDDEPGEVGPPAQMEMPGPGADEPLAAPPAGTSPEPALPPDARPAESPAKSAMEPVAPPATEAPAPGGWAVQVAALSKPDAANQVAADLKKKGYPAFVVQHRTDDRVLYRVRVGPEAQRETAEALAGRLREDGFKTAVVSQP
jgi:DedD protein